MQQGEVDNSDNEQCGNSYIGEMRVDETGTDNAGEEHIGEHLYRGSKVYIKERKRTYREWTK